jgi:DNA-binding HxlR family transcriptional regulator
MQKEQMLRAALSPAPNVFAVRCPSRGILEHLTSRWGVLILVALLGETMRFSALRRAIDGVSEKMLAQTLRTLERDGFVLRTAYPEVPPRVEYSLTPMGEEAAGHIRALTLWIEGALPRVMEAQALYQDRQGG